MSVISSFLHISIRFIGFLGSYHSRFLIVFIGGKKPENRMNSGENGQSFFLLVNHSHGSHPKMKLPTDCQQTLITM